MENKKSRNWGRVLGISISAVIVVTVMLCALLPSINCLEVNVEKIEKISFIISTGLLYLLALMAVFTIIWVISLFTTKWGRQCLSEMLSKQMEERQNENN